MAFRADPSNFWASIRNKKGLSRDAGLIGWNNDSNSVLTDYQEIENEFARKYLSEIIKEILNYKYQ